MTSSAATSSAEPVVACPAGQSPAAWLQLTAAERAALIEPPPLRPRGHMNRSGAFGFSPEGVVTGGWTFVEGSE